MRTGFLERWRLYVVWLDSALSGVSPEELWQTLGPVWVMLPLVRQIARALGPWLAALLAERARLGVVGDEQRWRAGELAEETRVRPLGREIDQHSAVWLKWLLEAELLRLVRLAEAPEEALQRRDWLAWEVRYWALAVRLARIGQLYAALQRAQDAEQAERLLKGALAHVWRQMAPTRQAA